MPASRELIEALAVTAELCGRTFSAPAAAMFVSDLDRYQEAQVMVALARCRREVRGVLTVSDVVSRLEDGRPGVEEAWAKLPMRESQTAVWTDEMSKAFGFAIALIDRGDVIGARMAFKESYTKEVARARDEGKPVRWVVSVGHDQAGRKPVIEQAVKQGLLTYEEAVNYVPEISYEVDQALIEQVVRSGIAIKGNQS